MYVYNISNIYRYRYRYVYICSLYVYTHIFGLYLLCICVLHAGNLAFLQDVVTRKMRKHAHVQQFFLYYLLIHTFAWICSIGAWVCKRCSFGFQTWSDPLALHVTSLAPLRAMSGTISQNLTRKSPLLMYPVSRLTDIKFIYIELPPVCISNVHLQCARSLSLHLSILLYIVHDIHDSERVLKIAPCSSTLFESQSRVHQVTELCGKQPKTFSQLAQHSIHCIGRQVLPTPCCAIPLGLASGAMRITIRSLNGENAELDVEPDTTILGLRQFVEDGNELELSVKKYCSIIVIPSLLSPS